MIERARQLAEEYDQKVRQAPAPARVASLEHAITFPELHRLDQLCKAALAKALPDSDLASSWRVQDELGLQDPEEVHTELVKKREVLLYARDLVRARRPLSSRTIARRKQRTILFLSADPKDAPRLRLAEELREIREKLALARMRSHFKLVDRGAVRAQDLTQALLDEKPAIVHFSGHGTSQGAVCLENDDGSSQPVPPEVLAKLFGLVKASTEVVVLNACYSEKQGAAIAKHVKYVIGMSDAIADKDAIAFSVGFYQGIGAGRSIVDAYSAGCVLMDLKGIPGHLTPVLVTA
ncbi:MAG: CHAT domain-containing protein [Chloroflexi bacterium]|nr:CHAT domain-containing protein [Chloroflexota bacterium]